MVHNPPKDMPRIVPYLHYRNMKAALQWLSAAFGFRVSFTLPDKEGNLMHAEMRFADGVVMFGPASKEQCGSDGTNGDQSPGRTRLRVTDREGGV